MFSGIPLSVMGNYGELYVFFFFCILFNCLQDKDTEKE